MIRGAAYDPLKRAIDVVVASVALVATSPLQLVVWVVVRWKLGKPALFRQPRPGKEEVIFELVKFRTMTEPDPTRGLVTDDERMTQLGAFLRSTSLDELPTLWNVLRGDMSLVGPRPLLVQYLERYTPEQARRHDARPGITGLAQVNGRNELSWPQKFALDVEYIETRSPIVDARIVLLTFGQVLGRRGISDSSGPTMTEFMGLDAGPSDV